METDTVLHRHAGFSISKIEKWRVFLEENSRSGHEAVNHTNKYEAVAFLGRSVLLVSWVLSETNIYNVLLFEHVALVRTLQLFQLARA